MRIALGIEYDGSQYYGWQRQNNVVSVQQEVETALSKICNHKVEVSCAGRTDSGVHGTGQIVHFETDAKRDESAFSLGMNSLLPDAVAVRWVKVVADDFHARYAARARRYRYVIYNSPLRPGILKNGVSHYHHPLDVDKMNQACLHLLGEHDFTSFRAIHCQAKTAFRNIIHLKVDRFGDFIVIDVKANAFLHHMVRNIAGTLIDIGMGKQQPDWIKEILDGKDRTKASATAKAGGLYLVDVEYPEKWGIPKTHPGPLFLPDF